MTTAMILYKYDAAGGFLCGDCLTGRTAYAYPTSQHAAQAARKPRQVAVLLLRAENAVPYEAYAESALMVRLRLRDHELMAQLRHGSVAI